MTFSIEKNIPLSSLTFFGIGGPADELVRISDITTLPDFWAETIATRLPHFVLGSGSNLVCSDQGFRGRVIIIDSEHTTWRENILTVDAGKNLQKLILEAAEHGLSDLTNLAGIPGTVGGAIRGNAGAFGSEISDTLISVEFCDQNGITRTLNKPECQFGYRNSIFKKNPNWCVMRATFNLTSQTHKNTAQQNAQQLIKERWDKYPSGRCGGSFFKNPNTAQQITILERQNANPYAGWLLEALGAKGDQVGEAQISDKHANFLMNTGHATQKDVITLATKWQQKVKEKFHITLEPEVMLIDQHGKHIIL